MSVEYRLYVVVNKINGKVYGGKHHYRANKKKSREYMGSGYALVSAIEKYGKENFERRWFKIKVETKEDLNRLEIKLIRRLHHKFGRENCYNIHKGGTGCGYTHYMTEEEIKEVNKKVGEGLKRMHLKRISNPDSEEYKEWKRKLYGRKETIRKRTLESGKTEKELKKRQFMLDNGFGIVKYEICFPNGERIIEESTLGAFLLKYKTESHVFSRIRRDGTYKFKKITKLTTHPFPKDTIIKYISEIRTFHKYKNEETPSSSVNGVSDCSFSVDR